MFKTPLLLSLLSLLTLSFFVTLSLMRVEKKDVQQLEKLMKTASGKKQIAPYSENQRHDVVKEVWFKEKEVHHLRIESKESALFFFHEGKNLEVVEQMDAVECLMQEKLFLLEGKPMQEVRHLTAKKASYNYSTSLFIAYDVVLSKFHLQGHTLPRSLPEELPLMQGIASTVQFVLRGKNIDFKAHHFKGSFDLQRGAL